jgi:hypothetical protein
MPTRRFLVAGVLLKLEFPLGNRHREQACWLFQLFLTGLFLTAAKRATKTASDQYAPAAMTSVQHRL